jgi:DNA polymerase-3 subunit epsilon
MGEMVGLAESVVGIECATPLEAEVRELRLIKEHKPRYNRRSRHPERAQWLKLTVEPWPRLSLVRQVLDDGATYLGPFGSRRVADRAAAALHEAFPIRQCKTRMAREPRLSACVLAEMGRCLSPCDGTVAAAPYADVVARLRQAVTADPREVVEAIQAKMASLAAACRFEDAAVHRDRLTAFVRAAGRRQRLVALTRCPEVVAARRDDSGAWAVHVVRHGRLAAAGVIPPGAHAGEWVRTLRAGAETVVPGPGPAPAATPEETEKILRWLESPGVRLVHLDGEWSCPVGGAEGHRRTLDAVETSKASLVPFDDRRDLPVHHRPTR